VPKNPTVIVAAWCERDHARALLPADHEIIDSTHATRALVVERLLGPGDGRDLYNACAVLGRLIAERGGSPTLATATIDGAHEAMGGGDVAWLIPARAALAEGFASARQEATRRDAAAAWDFPRCAADLGDGAFAIVAGYPDDDGEALAAWASRVAQAVALAGARRAVVSGSDAARAALGDALQVVGVTVVATRPLASASSPTLGKR
jgi:hypothetical protein